MRQSALVAAVTLLVLTGCGEPNKSASSAPAEAAPGTTSGAKDSTEVTNDQCSNFAVTRQPLFGDLHVHTSLSFDAAANSIGSTPADAQRYAQGEAIAFFPVNDAGKPIGTAQIDRPLDFLAVTDHGEFLGERALCRTPGSPVYDGTFCTNFRADQRQGMMMLGTVITTETPKRIAAVCGADGSNCPEFAKGPWQDVQDAANNANSPCEFTSFVAYEYTGTPGTSNYHRNVIFRNDKVPGAPVSYVDAPIDSKLWDGLDAVCLEADGCDYLTIPHNTNLANGRMAPYRKLPDTLAAKQAYATKRLRREPIMEIFQHKGGSECVNGLSSIFGAPDELCNIEAVRRMGESKSYATRALVDGVLQVGQASEITAECKPNEVGANGMLGAGCIHPTDFQRSALLVGLAEEQATGLNPIKLGVIASTDTHTATPGGVEESTWVGAVTGEATSTERLMPGVLTSGIDGNPGGLAGIWATENTRDAVFDAMLRREVFGTSGPRIVPRLFAAWDLAPDLCDNTNRDQIADQAGVPMGGDLTAPAERTEGETKTGPTFLAHASKDPEGRDLTELHLIKGWVGANGELTTKVITLAESKTGANSLCAVYTDPQFDPKLSAYYYLRAVEGESARWHTFDCARLPEEVQPEVCRTEQYPRTIREMAWSSPIWYERIQ